MYIDTYFRRELLRTKRLIMSRRVLFDYLNRHKHHTHGQTITERQDEAWSKHLNLLYSKVVSENKLLEEYLDQNRKEIESMMQQEAVVIEEMMQENDWNFGPEPIDYVREAEAKREKRLRDGKRATQKFVRRYCDIYGCQPVRENGKTILYYKQAASHLDGKPDLAIDSWRSRKLLHANDEHEDYDFPKHKDSHLIRRNSLKEIEQQLDEQMRTFFEENAEFVRNYELDCN